MKASHWIVCSNLTVALLCSCAPMMNTPAAISLTAEQALSPRTEIVASVSQVLTEYGYAIALANEQTGSVTTQADTGTTKSPFEDDLGIGFRHFRGKAAADEITRLADEIRQIVGQTD